MTEKSLFEEKVSIGKIGRYRGKKGEAFIHTHFDLSTESLKDIEVEIRWPNSKRILKTRLVRVWWQGIKTICQLECCTSIEDVRSLVHGEIFIEKGQLKPLEENQYFKIDLLGLNVQTTDGLKLGAVVDIIDTQASALLQVGEKRNILIPLVPEIVVNIDQDKGEITIDPPEGLLEVNED